MNYTHHIGIIGAGISGLTLACALKKFGIETIIFEKSKNISQYGAGISISRNGLAILNRLDIIELFKENSYQPKLVSWNYKNREFHNDTTDVFTASRKILIQTLYEKYNSLGGEVLFDHEVSDIKDSGKVINFINKKSYNIKHIAVCDGIKSSIRDNYFLETSDIRYSGFNAWRGIGKSQNRNVEFHFGKNSHLVRYPINNNLDQSFVGVIKDKKWNKESWKHEGSIKDFLSDFKSNDNDIESTLLENQKIFKWGIFIRPPIKKIFKDSVTLFGDAAHPMVPFMGQGACMAIEDAYTFALLLKRLNMNFETTQKIYNKIRVVRNDKIQKMSMQQAKLNHIKNHFIASVRNFIMKKTNVVSNRTNIIWAYDAHDHIESELRKL